jgi:hypothetical protein
VEKGGRGGHQASRRARGAALAEVWRRAAAADTRRTAAVSRDKKSKRMNPAHPAANKQQRKLKRKAESKLTTTYKITSGALFTA